MVFGKKQPESFLGVDIGAGGIKIVELKKTKGRPQLWTYGVANKQLDIHVDTQEMPEIQEVMENNIEKKKEVLTNSLNQFASDSRVIEYGGLLKELITQAKVTTNVATASLPVSYIFHALVTLPPVERRDLPHHIQAKIKKMIPQAIEDMQVVFQQVPDPLAEKQKYYKYLVTAAPKKLVSFYSAIFQHAGLQLKELETEAFALTRSLVGLDTSVSMIVDIGAERTNFFIVDQGLPMTHRSIQLGGRVIDKILAEKLGIDESQAKQIKQDVSLFQDDELDAELFRPVLRPVMKEIEYSFDLFLRQSGNEAKKPEKIILTGGSAVFPVFTKLIEESFPLRVFVGDPWARVVYQQGLKKALDAMGPRMSVSIGLAMRNIV